jgi:hypothetical protein
MKVLARFKEVFGDIVFQSHGSQAGETQLDYVKIMKAFLSETENVLVLGCGGGNLATMLARSGEAVRADAIGQNEADKKIPRKQSRDRMNEKLPAPCERCHATGQCAGLECHECRGKGYRLIVGGRVTASARSERSKRKRWRGKPRDRT